MGRSKLQNERFCVICGSHTTYFTKSGYAQWRRVHGHYMCNRCYFREIFNPCSLKFKEKRLTLPTVARTHICGRCGNKIGDEYINSEGVSARTKRTVIHYDSYNDNNVLENAEELCASCHARAVWTLERRLKHSNIIRKSWQEGVYKDRKRK